MQYSSLKIAGIEAVMAKGEQAPHRAVVLFHGFGANARDLAPIASEINLGSDIVWVFPEGLLALDGFGSRAWWHIDLPALGAAIAEGRRRDRTLESPPGLPPARETALRLLAALETEYGIPARQVVLGGFSQGAMLATDATLHLPVDTAGLLLFSGTLLCRDIWVERARNHAGLPFFQSHGMHDPLLAFEAAQELNRLLLDAGLAGSLVAFPGGHEIPDQALRGAEAFLRSVLGDTEV